MIHKFTIYASKKKKPTNKQTIFVFFLISASFITAQLRHTISASIVQDSEIKILKHFLKKKK
jgi:hypothetical protein